jgi:hypothetical protein
MRSSPADRDTGVTSEGLVNEAVRSLLNVLATEIDEFPAIRTIWPSERSYRNG